MSVEIITADVFEGLAKLPDESVHCVVTSPPYWGLRDYGTDGQMGLEPTLAEHLDVMVKVFEEVRRVLRPDGTLWLNYGSAYATSGSASSYGISDKALRDYRENGYPSESLCGGCRDTSSIRTSHSGDLHERGLAGEPYAQIQGRKELERAHPATLDFSRPPSSQRALCDSRGRHKEPSAQATSAGEPRQSSGARSLQPLQVGKRMECSQKVSASLSESETFYGDVPECDRRLDADVEMPCCTESSAKPFGERVLRIQCISGYCSRCGAWSDDLRSNIIDPQRTAAVFKAKDEMMLPNRLAIALQEAGWFVRSEIIWSKMNPMPESATDRPTSAHEKIFLLTKKARYFYDADAVREHQADTEHTRSRYQYAPSEAPKHDGDVNSNRTSKDFAQHFGTGSRNLRNVWTIATAPYSEAHFATFPPALAEKCIKAGTSAKGCCSECGAPWVRETDKTLVVTRPGLKESQKGLDKSSSWGGYQNGRSAVETTGWLPSCKCNAEIIPCTVLDIFGGAGTTGLVADRLQRNAILIELNPEYAAMARKRIDQDRGGGLLDLMEAAPEQPSLPEPTE